MNDWDLIDEQGNRKYLTSDEREAFFNHIDKALASTADREKRTFALMLYFTGCRISEALAVNYGNIDYAAQGVILKTLKRRKTIHRFVPLPYSYLTKLDDVHRVKDFQQGRGGRSDRIWSFSRTTAWRTISSIMDAAGIKGVQANPKALRHSFVIQHQELGTPDHMIQRWAGWASRDMMEVYGRAVGKEEQSLASKLWMNEKF